MESEEAHRGGPPPAGRSRAREEKAARHSAEGLAAALARGERANVSPAAASSLLEWPMIAGSRLRVWRSLRLEKLLEEEGEVLAEGEEEQEKTLLSRLCADIPVTAELLCLPCPARPLPR